MKKGNIALVLLVALIVITAGAAITTTAVSSRYQVKDSYERLQNRYLAESGIDMAISLFINYLAQQDYVLTFQRDETGSYTVMDEYAPYLTDEMKQTAEADRIKMQLVSTESSDYLSSIGFLDFARDEGVELFIETYGQKEMFRLSRMGYDSGFNVSKDGTKAESKLNPIAVTVTSKYKSGEALCTAEISGLRIAREKINETAPGQMTSTSAKILTAGASIQYTNYQNYRIKKG